MNKSRWLLIALALGACIVCYILVLTVQEQFRAPSLTEADVTQKVERLYRGTTESVVKSSDHYIVSFKRADGVYEVKIEGKTGHVGELAKVIAFDDVAQGDSSTANNEVSGQTEDAEQNNNAAPPAANATPPSDKEEPPASTEPSTAPPASNVTPPTNTAPPAAGSTSNSGSTANPGTSTQPPKTQIYITAAKAQQIALKQLAGEVDDIEYVRTSDGGYYLIDIEAEEEDATFQIHAVTGKILSVSYDD